MTKVFTVSWEMRNETLPGNSSGIICLGGGSEQSVWSSVAESLVRQIIHLYNLSPIDNKSWEEALSIVFGQINVLPEKHLLIILDAVDQLDIPYGHEFHFPLPIECPKNMKILLSTREDNQTLEEFKARNYPSYRIEPLQKEQRRTMVSDYLSLFGKHLDDNQIERIIDSPIADNNLQLKTLLEELIKWVNYINLDRKIIEYISETDVGFYSKLFKEYQAEFGESCLMTLSYVALSRKGLSESDILGISGLSPKYSTICASVRLNASCSISQR